SRIAFLLCEYVEAVATAGFAAVTALQEIICGEDVLAVFDVVVFAFDDWRQVVGLLFGISVHQRKSAVPDQCPEIAIGCMAGVSTTTPSLKLTCFPEIAGTRSPGTTIPARFNGSAAEMVMISSVGGMFLMARSDSTAMGSANCSPMNEAMKRPPRTSPRSSSRRKAMRSSRHLGRMLSRASNSRKTTPYRLSNMRQTPSMAWLVV